ncbi:MAG TPA: histidine kinase dimerization/phospho-acceptor domain-containing protein, partial [Anaerolineae bacterium]|nr:histidine kinase dimerization/phospho-acceptor domain-containing protein [Anaerolineae bacterium]
ENGANKMIKPEERDQLITTYCATFKGTADDIAQRCEILLANDNDLFNDEQKTWITHIQTAIQKFLSLVETVRQVAVTQGWAGKGPAEFDEFIAIWINDLRTPLSVVIGFARFLLEGGRGLLNDKQQEAIEYVYKLVQSLLSTIIEFRISSRQE